MVIKKNLIHIFIFCFIVLNIIIFNSSCQSPVVSTTPPIGAIWKQATSSAEFSPRYGHTSVVFDNKMWVIGGTNGFNYFNDTWYSTDGIKWTQATAEAAFPARYGHTSVVFNNKMWVIGGSIKDFAERNDVWYSSDGITWQEATHEAAFPVRQGHSSETFNNRIWVIGGGLWTGGGLPEPKKDVWFSMDGITWTETTAEAAFEYRFYSTCLVFENKIWVIGGSVSLGGETNDYVWYSVDGHNWNQAVTQTVFNARYTHNSVVFNNEMWVIGGAIFYKNRYDTTLNPVGAVSDVWHSKDGINWYEATSKADFAAKTLASSLVYNNKMWIIGGTSANGSLNSVWYSQ